MDLASRVLRFGELLRLNDLIVGTGHVEDALRATNRIDIGDRTEFYFALRAIFLSDPEQRERFDYLFDRFWREEQPPSIQEPSRTLRQQAPVPASPSDDTHFSFQISR